MDQREYRNMTDEERLKHEIAMGFPLQQSRHPQDLKGMLNAYRPTITEADLKTVKKKRWWQFWKSQ